MVRAKEGEREINSNPEIGIRRSDSNIHFVDRSFYEKPADLDDRRGL